MATWIINREAHGKHVTCQRPIVMELWVLSGYLAGFEGTLLIEDGPGTNQYADTNVRFNVYQKNSGTTNQLFECNVAEYCRQYIKNQNFWYQGNWCASPNVMFNRKFQVRFSPVTVAPDGTLNVDYTDEQTTEAFNVIPLNTQVWENNSTEGGDYHRIDFYVNNGSNGGAGGTFDSSYAKYLSNMPDLNEVYLDYGYPWVQLSLLEQNSGTNRYRRIRTTTDSGATFDMMSNNLNTAVDGVVMMDVSPMMIEFLYAWINSGTQWNQLVDASGNAAADWYTVKVDYTSDAAGTNVVKGGPPAKKFVIKKDVACGNQAGKNETMFVFRNMRGGMDWFIAKGKKEKSVEISGLTYNKHTQYNRASDNGSNFLTRVGEHSTTNLWNDRKDSFKVFSQPLTRDKAEWLEELIISPQVWIVENQDGIFEPNGNGSDNILVAIVIDKGSYAIYNTEENVSYLEFNYYYSEPTLTQKN